MGSKTFSIFMKPGFSTVCIGTISFAIYIAIASVMAFQRGEFFSYGMQLAKVCVTVVCILVAVRLVLVVPRSPSFRCAQHFSHSAGCFCLRCCSKFVVLLPLLATDFEQTLQRGVVCSKSDLANANQFQITDDTVPFLGTYSSRLAAMFVCASLW